MLLGEDLVGILVEVDVGARAPDLCNRLGLLHGEIIKGTHLHLSHFLLFLLIFLLGGGGRLLLAALGTSEFQRGHILLLLDRSAA